MDKRNNNSVNILSILTIVFTIAKITGYISWSWWLVLMPVTIQFVIALLLIGVGFYIGRDS